MPATARFNQLNLVVADMDATLAFFRLLGLDIPDDAARATDGHHVDLQMPGGFSLDLDSVELGRVYNAASRPPGGGGAVIGFGVDSREDVDTCYERLVAAGHPGAQAPFDAFWGARYAIVEDPNGYHIGIMSPIDESRRAGGPGPG